MRPRQAFLLLLKDSRIQGFDSRIQGFSQGLNLIPSGLPGDRVSIRYCEGARGNLSSNRRRLQEFICESLCGQWGADTAFNENLGHLQVVL